MDFLDVERKFSNLQSLWSGTALEVNLFGDAARAAAFKALIGLQRLLRNETELFEPLLKWLSHLHWDLRGFVGSASDASDHWQQRCSELANHFASLEHVLDENRIGTLRGLMETLRNLQDDDKAYRDHLLKTIDGFDSVVIVERQWQRRYVKDFFTGVAGFEALTITHLSAFLRGQYPSYSATYILATPSRIPDNFMRALILGGAIESAEFISPNWIVGKEPQKLRQDLAPGLTSVRKPTLRVKGDILFEDHGGLTDAEIGTFTYMPTHGDFEKYSSRGAIKCRLIEVANDYVMPIEPDASRVSVLSDSPDTGLAVQFRVPGKTLEVGDVLFELRDGAEEDFLMDAAEIQMGKQFDDFAKGRAEWKARARKLVRDQGLDSAVKQLKKSGVGTAENLMEWLDNDDFTTPRATKDWKNLLVALGFSNSEVNEMVSLGSRLRSTLIEIGRTARKHMADAVSREDLERVLSHQVITKQLDEFGDAVFVIGMVTGIGDSETTCEPTEIRRVLRG